MTTAAGVDGLVTVTLLWNLPYLRNRNGVIQDYNLHYEAQGKGRATGASSAPGRIQTKAPLEESVKQTIIGLDGNRLYVFTLSPCTLRYQCGPVSTGTITTAETG